MTLLLVILPADQNDGGCSDNADKGDCTDNIEPRWTRIKLRL